MQDYCIHKSTMTELPGSVSLYSDTDMSIMGDLEQENVSAILNYFTFTLRCAALRCTALHCTARPVYSFQSSRAIIILMYGS